MGPSPRQEPAEGTRVMPVSQQPPPDSTRVMPTSARGAGSYGPGYQDPDGGQWVPRPGPRPVQPEPEHPGRPRRGRRLRPLRWVAAIVVLLVVLVGARVGWLAYKVNEGLSRVGALPNASTSDGETWLIVGSDARDAKSGTVKDDTQGARADSIMVLNKAPNGQVSMVSLPRDTYVEIPGQGGNKINAAYSYGGSKLLVATVEKLTGLTVDHYAEVGMGAVEQLVDAVGGVELCLNYDVVDPDSGLVWDTRNGQCQKVDGEKALAYSRMRKSDPTGDIGRGQRQRAVISAVASEAMSFQTVYDFPRQDALVEATTQAVAVDQDTGTLTLAQMVMAFREASGSGLTGPPPIESLSYEPGGIGQAVLLQGTTAPEFFAAVREGTLTADSFTQAQ